MRNVPETARLRPPRWPPRPLREAGADSACRQALAYFSQLPIRVISFYEVSAAAVQAIRSEQPEMAARSARLDTMIDTVTEPDPSASVLTADEVMRDWKAAIGADLDRVIVQGGGRWSRALMLVAWIHLATFVACQAINDPGVHPDMRHLALWVAELVAVIVAMRKIAGLGWFSSSPAINIIGRLWATFLILSFNAAVLNGLTGWESVWYRAIWGTLSTFLFASMAWLITPKFLIPAVQMYFTALLMARFPAWNNLFYGVSWWFALAGTAWVVRNREHAGPPRSRHLIVRIQPIVRAFAYQAEIRLRPTEVMGLPPPAARNR